MVEFSGTREAFAAALTDLAAADPAVMLVSADSLKAMRATAFADRFPDRYVEVGIAEQAAVAAAAGMATCGLKPYVATYAGFLTMRACEQMRTFTAYPNLKVTFIGINAGVIGGEREGVTHQFYEDLGTLSAIPNFTIFTPADGNQTYHAVKTADRISGPVYIRAGSGREPEVYSKDAPFNPDGMTILRDDGTDAVLFASGFILDRVLAAADILRGDGVRVKVADVNILGPVADRAILALMRDAKAVFTIEDHNINGGLGSRVCHLACEHQPKRVTRLGLTSFAESGPAAELADAYGFSPAAIAASVRAGL
ncbi:MAG: transketolase [Planctomycetes bacterium]|nr:transketolase [Planctomycetota bacterium]